MLRAAPWMPPDCSASRPRTAEATALLAWELTAPTPMPPSIVPANRATPTASCSTPRAMRRQAATMAARPMRMMRRDERRGASFGRNVARQNMGMPDSSDSMPLCMAEKPATSIR